MEKEFTVSKEDIAAYVANGGDLDLLTVAQRKAIPQDVIVQYVIHGGYLGCLTDEQKRQSLNMTLIYML